MPKITPKLASKPVTTATKATTTAPGPPSSPPAATPAAEATATTTTTTLESIWLTALMTKAANERTFATQRAKKASDRAKGKAPPRKQPPSAGGRSSSAASSPPIRSGTSAATMSWAEVWDARKVSSADDLDWPELPTPLSLSQRWSPSPSPAEHALRPTQDREVPLSALVRPLKARGAKAKKDGEFEFLPPVKNVIALDDADSNVPDEPWEYISSVGADDEARKIFSYAEIVSKSA